MNDETDDEALRRIIRSKNDALRLARNAIESLRCALRRSPAPDSFAVAAMGQGQEALARISRELP